MLTVTFDSNVIEKVLDPSKVRPDDDKAAYNIVNSAIMRKIVIPSIPESYFTYEQISKLDRKEIAIENARHSVSIEQLANEENNFCIRITLGASPEYGMVKLDRYRTETLSRLRDMGGNVLRTWMIGGFLCADFKESDFRTEEDLPEIRHRNEACWGFISDELRAGLGAFYDTLKVPITTPFFRAIRSTCVSDMEFSKAFAEYADALAVSIHYGHSIRFFCTNDLGRGAVRNSVMTKQNKESLRNRFGIEFCTIEYLAKIVNEIGT